MEEEFKRCPYCAEDIKFAAIKCKHCGEDIIKGKKNDWTNAKGVNSSLGSVVVKEKSTALDIVFNTIIVICTIIGLFWLAYQF